MLNKKLCKKCCKEAGGWMRWFERSWKKGELNCPWDDYLWCEIWDAELYFYHPITAEPPRHCPYILEQIVNA